MKYFIKTLKLLLLAICILFVWYAVSRIYHGHKPVRVYAIDQNIAHRPLNNRSLVIGSYNIAHGRGGEYGASNWQNRSKEDLFQHLDNIANQISEANLDVIVLNEVDFRAAWSHNINQAEYLMKK